MNRPNTAGHLPKNGIHFKAISVHRISRDSQDPRSLGDQAEFCRQWVSTNVEQPSGFSIQYRSIDSQASGERLDRAELEELESAIETREFDLVIAEDLGRISRRQKAIEICELAEDHHTRLVAINDSVDTAKEDWRINAMIAAFRHEMYNADTAKRIRRTQRNRFTQGGMVQCEIYGYVKPHAGATDDQLTKDPAAEPIVAEIFRKLEQGAGYAEICDWLNDEKVPLGKYARGNRWVVSTLARWVHCSILKGVRERNNRISVRVNKTGRRRTMKAPPEELLTRKVGHLAFIEPERYDRIVAMVDARNAQFGNKGKNGKSTLKDVPKKRTRFPGQQVSCAICGHPFVWGGNGQSSHLMCKGAKDYRCWQSITFDGELATKVITEAVHREIENLPGFEETLVNEVEQEYAKLVDNRQSELMGVEAQIQQVERKLERFMQLIGNGRQGAGTELIMFQIDELAEEQKSLQRQRDYLISRPSQAPELPSIESIKDMAREALTRDADSPYEFSRVMRQLIPRIWAFPVRLCDGGRLTIQATMDLHLLGLFPQLKEIPSIDQVLTRRITVNLFEPIQRDRFREVVVMMQQAGMKQRDIAYELEITHPAVQYAMRLQHRMEDQGSLDPYVRVTAPPDDLTKLRRHKHRRYRFEPVPGFEPPK